jgi:CHAT domain-containing protein
VNEFRVAIEQRIEDDTRNLGEALWRHLIGPIAPMLKEAGIKTLMITPYGTLRYLPFAALHDGERYLIERFALSFVTLAAQGDLRDRPKDQWSVAGLGVGREAPNYRRLIAVPEELHGIVRTRPEDPGVYPGVVHLDEAFTEGSFAKALKAHPVVHVASHFVFNPAQGLRSHLLLGDGHELTLDRMRDLSFDFLDIELMTLSACETAMGDGQENGSEFEGLGALVQQRGAKAVIASLWSVADDSTALLMTHLYKGKSEGQSKAAALRQAQMSFLATPRAHPYYWAAFILMGNWL